MPVVEIIWRRRPALKCQYCRRSQMSPSRRLRSLSWTALEEHLPTIVDLNIKGRLPATTEAANMAKHCARRMRMGMTKTKSSPSLPFLEFG